ncbi:hypothetical protein CSB45_00935 [candidate division KSB3 bacterium]|uniref:Uncharacterized protein n=1 Tax=candidate division KSB3 bacterium TaxID=2044937 RepID=A0A2G6EBV5_9BACT|nr:MAG: hypothetical protein CSB45_00935 [candidate division KSB3 bacterium]
MERSHINILKGAGSILDIMPGNAFNRYTRYIPDDSPQERTRKTWERVGKSISRAMGEFEREQETHKK